MAQIWKVRLPNGNVVTPGDWTAAEPLYSTIEVGAAGFQERVAFSYGRGATVPGSVGPRQSTLIDTNLQGQGNQLPENEELVVYMIGIELFKQGAADSVDRFPDADNPHVPLPDMLRMQRDMVIRLKIANVKFYTNAPLSYFPSGTGVQSMYSGGRSFVSGAAANGEVPANNGNPSTEGTRELASPLQVAGGETFGVSFRPSSPTGDIQNLNLAANSRIRCRVYLDGFRRRPVA